MSRENDNQGLRIGLWLVGGVVALATLSVLLFAVRGSDSVTDMAASVPVVAEVVIVDSAASEAAVVEDLSAQVAAASNSAEIIAPSDVAPDDSNLLAVGEHDAAVVVENGVVKFYFASGKADLAVGAAEALKDVLVGVKQGGKAIVSGYHDTAGNQVQDEELSTRRVLSVKNALLGFGVAEEQIEMRKPDGSDGGGSNAEARRVEVILE